MPLNDDAAGDAGPGVPDASQRDTNHDALGDGSPPREEPSSDASDASDAVDSAAGAPDANTPEPSDASAADASMPDASAGDADTPEPSDASAPSMPDASGESCPGPNPSPAPLVTSVGPTPLPTTPSGSVIDVDGSSFTQCTTIRILGTSGFWQFLPTTYVSPTQLSATLSNALRPQYRENWIHAYTPAPGGGESQMFRVYRMPVPEVGSLDPASVLAGTSTFTLTVSSKYLNQPSSWLADTFDSGANVYFDSTPLEVIAFTCPLGFDIYCSLSVTIPAALVGTAGTASITVVNPGVTPSKPVPFQIQ